MIDHGLLNATESDRAHWQMLWDPSLAWIMGPPGIMPLVFNGDGALMLRSWPGEKFPVPRDAAAVGFALRPAATVASDGSVTYGNAVHWHLVDKVSGGGVVAPRNTRLAKAAVWDAGAYVGLIPNAPIELRGEQTDDQKIRLTWIYNKLGQQAAPTSFDIFHDNGTGTVDLATPLDDETYTDGRTWYHWTSAQFNDGDTRLYTVRAKTAGGVYSLIPKVGSPHQGTVPTYSSVAGKYCVNVTIVATAPSDPAAPVFG